VGQKYSAIQKKNSLKIQNASFFSTSALNTFRSHKYVFDEFVSQNRTHNTKAVGFYPKHVYCCLTKLQAHSLVLFIRSPLAALLHADWTGKNVERDVVAGAARARKVYTTTCPRIQSVQPVCVYNQYSLPADTISTACLRIQPVQPACGYNQYSLPADTISTACLRIQSVQPVCGYNYNSVRLWIQFVHRLSVDTRSTAAVCGHKPHSPYICKENADFSIKASWRMPAAGKVQQSGAGHSG